MCCFVVGKLVLGMEFVPVSRFSSWKAMQCNSGEMCSIFGLYLFYIFGFQKTSSHIYIYLMRDCFILTDNYYTCPRFLALCYHWLVEKSFY